MSRPSAISLADKTALITGATSGIGRAISEYFAACGARLMLTGRNREAGAELAGRLGARFVWLVDGGNTAA
jgi:NADP-dependent 3-hydroxy acid dehydrogenase YdfG